MTNNVVERRLPVPYAPEIAVEICDLIANGKTLVEIADTPGLPTRQTIYRWLTLYPKFFDAYERAKEISAQSLEDEALEMARTLKGANDFTGTKVQAYNIAMQQLRWSAARRDKTRYGQQVQGQTTVPIQINTTLNLGQAGQPVATDIAQSIYTVEATVTVGNGETSGYDEDNVETLSAEGEVLDLTAEPGDTDKLPFGLPETDRQELHRPKSGRPVGSKNKRSAHKSPAAAQRSALAYAEKERKRLAKLAEAATKGE